MGWLADHSMDTFFREKRVYCGEMQSNMRYANESESDNDRKAKESGTGSATVHA
jgi:hypothetical protein